MRHFIKWFNVGVFNIRFILVWLTVCVLGDSFGLHFWHWLSQQWSGSWLGWSHICQRIFYCLVREWKIMMGRLRSCRQIPHLCLFGSLFLSPLFLSPLHSPPRQSGVPFLDEYTDTQFLFTYLYTPYGPGMNGQVGFQGYSQLTCSPSTREDFYICYSMLCDHRHPEMVCPGPTGTNL